MKKSASVTSRTPGKGTGRRTTHGRALPSELKLKQPFVKPQTAKTRRDQAIEYARKTSANVDVSDVVGSTQLAEGEATRKLWERHRKRSTAKAAEDRAAKSIYGSRTKVSVARIEKDKRGGTKR